MQHVVKEAILAVPHLIGIRTDSIHRIGNPEKVLKESKCGFLVDRIVFSEDERNLQHVLAIKGHPGSAVCLVEPPTGGKFSAAIEDADIVETQKAAGEYVTAVRILAVHPPIEIQHQALEGALEEANVGAAEFLLDVIEE